MPIIPDEGRTFGLDALFSEVKIYAAGGQTYTPVDANLLLSYAESASGQILEEGITEAGAMASFQAAGTAYSTWSTPTVPFFMFYSMFGFQRVGDLIWQAADARCRGFLLGCTAGRTTLNGEGLQHEDGHSHALASVVPNVMAYDPAFAYEVAVIVEEGLRRDVRPQRRGPHLLPDPLQRELPHASPGGGCGSGSPRGRRWRGGGEEGDPGGDVPFRASAPPAAPSGGAPEDETGNGQALRRASVLFSGPMWQAAMKAREMLVTEWGVSADAWSVTSYKALRDDALEVERWNRLHPGEPARTSYVARELAGTEWPVVAVSDFIKLVPDQISRFVPGTFVPLGTDGFGRSDTRDALRRHFEIDAEHIVVATLSALAASGQAKEEEVAAAIARYGIDPEAVDPRRA